jgi:hypothetical protein
MNRYKLAFWISFAIGGGGAYLTAVANGIPTTISGIVVLVSAPIVTGIMTGAQAVQKLIETPPP